MGLFKPHRPSQYPSLLLWALDETHVTVTLATAAWILWTQDAHSIWFGAGALLSSVSAKAVKHFIKDPRPPPASSAPSPVRPKTTYGMPSTHSTALSFYFFYLVPYFPHWTRPWLYGTGVTVYWAAGVWSRVKLGYHTWEQVLGGVAFGAALAWGWRSAWKANPWIGRELQGLVDVVVTRTMALLGR